MKHVVVMLLTIAGTLLWRHRGKISYGAVMFLLGMWAASGSDNTSTGKIANKTPVDEQVEIVILEDEVEYEGDDSSEFSDGIASIFSSEYDDSEDELVSPSGYDVDMVVRKGDTFIQMLSQAGVSHKEAYAASKSLKGVFDLRSLKVGQKIIASFEEDVESGEAIFVKLTINKPGSAVIIDRKEEGFVASKVEKTLHEKLRRAGGEIESSLFQLGEDTQVPVAVIMEAIRAFSYDVDFQRDIRKGSSFEVMYGTYYDEDGAKVRDGDLHYAMLKVPGEEFKIYSFAPEEGKNGFYTESGRTVRKALLRTPMNGGRISSRYGMRKHPVLGYNKMHKGVDFAAPTGTPILAAGDGTIEKIGRYGAYGKYIRIRHNGTYSTAYAHLSRYAKGLRKGRRVKQGQVIGYVGTTGRSTGPHLHYETLVNGKHKNPLKLKMAPGVKLSGKKLRMFEAHKHELDILLASLPLNTQLASRE